MNDQLPLLIGQLEKQSGRSIARIGGEKGEKVVFGVVALLFCAFADTLCEIFEFYLEQILLEVYFIGL